MNNRANNYYQTETSLAESFGVTGSPTPMINEFVFDGDFCTKNASLCARSPEAIKKAICQGFETEPSECSQSLSDEVPSPGFGQGTGGSSQGGCQ